MKTIGLIGGITWQSTVEYYRIINNETKKLLGGSHSARILMYSFDWEEINGLRSAGRFEDVGPRLAEEAKHLESIGADVILLCANTAHKFASLVQNEISVTLLHIADASGKEIQKLGLKKVLLLGTKYTMQERYIADKLENEYQTQVVVPEENDLLEVSRIIFEELVDERILQPSKEYLANLISKTPDIEGVILGCTELPLIIKPEDTPLTLIDTTYLHAKAAVEFANGIN
ncbi:MAG TPA: amino acid racemase [Bacteroidales bacterium]|nr:amino acid racemase [Bacteroidales bacterium]HRX96384.1 amino acid racemase [Bacteroidales bacterium]